MPLLHAYGVLQLLLWLLLLMQQVQRNIVHQGSG